jgi:hypothetical protein
MNKKITKIIENNLPNCDLEFKNIENKIEYNSTNKKNKTLVFVLIFSTLLLFAVSIPVAAITISNSFGANPPSVELSVSEDNSISNYKASL